MFIGIACASGMRERSFSRGPSTGAYDQQSSAADADWPTASDLGFNRCKQRTRNCVSRRSVADEATATDLLHGDPGRSRIGDRSSVGRNASREALLAGFNGGSWIRAAYSMQSSETPYIYAPMSISLCRRGRHFTSRKEALGFRRIMAMSGFRGTMMPRTIPANKWMLPSVPPATNAATNWVLASIPRRTYKRLAAQLEPVTLKYHQVLYEPGGPIKHVYFPINCLISLLTSVDKRRTLEVGMVGNEGMAGMPFILGMGISGARALVQRAAARCAWPPRRSVSSSTEIVHCRRRFTDTPTR